MYSEKVRADVRLARGERAFRTGHATSTSQVPSG